MEDIKRENAPLVATFAKRQRKISSDFKFKDHSVEEPIHQLDRVEEHVEEVAVGTPEVGQAPSEQLDLSPTAPSVDPELVAFFNMLDQEELLVEEENDNA